MKNGKHMKSVIAIIVVVLVVTAGVIYGYNKYHKDLARYVTIDINPSVELALNSDDEVIDVVALNEDADIITSDLDLVGLSVEDATKLIIDSATETGYIDEFGTDNVVTVTAYSEDENVVDSIEEKVVVKAESVLEEKNIFGSIVSGGVTDEMKVQADEYDISYGKMLLIEKAYALNNTLDKDELATLSVKDIQAEIKTAVQTRYEQKSMTQEQVKEQAQVQKEVKKEETAAKMNEVIEDVTSANQDLLKDKDATQKQEIINDLLEQKKEEIKKQASQGNSGNANTGNSSSSNGNSSNTSNGNSSQSNSGNGNR